MSVAPVMPLTAEHFLEWERAQPEKHEYVRGEVLPMAGASLRHNALASRMGAALHSRLGGRGGEVLSSDQKLAAPAGEQYFYPDRSLPSLPTTCW